MTTYRQMAPADVIAHVKAGKQVVLRAMNRKRMVTIVSLGDASTYALMPCHNRPGCLAVVPSGLRLRTYSNRVEWFAETRVDGVGRCQYKFYPVDDGEEGEEAPWQYNPSAALRESMLVYLGLTMDTAQSGRQVLGLFEAPMQTILNLYCEETQIRQPMATVEVMVDRDLDVIVKKARVPSEAKKARLRAIQEKWKRRAHPTYEFYVKSTPSPSVTNLINVAAYKQ